MKFKYSVTFPMPGGNKLKRFREWADAHLPDLGYVLPPQTPIKSETLTIRLRSVSDRARVLETMAKASVPRESEVAP